MTPLCAPEDHKPAGPPLNENELERAARMFRAIGDPERLRLIVLLARGPACVTELAVAENQTLSTISQRLRVLRAENLIVRERHGKHIHYKLADNHIAELIANVMARRGAPSVKWLAFALILAAPALGQDAPAPNERWNLYWQATSIGQYHGMFNSPYQGANSLLATAERDASLTTTAFLGIRITDNWQLYFDPEIAGGRGFSGVTGIANFPNGELPRISSATPKPYVARLYTTYDFGIGDEKENIESDANQLSGTRPMVRYSVTAGRFTVTDFFDNNRYTHDPRMQFMGWSAMYNGAWDYAADTRGYTWGWEQEFHTRNWTFRYASVLEPKKANGQQLDRRIFRDRGDNFEVERRYRFFGHDGAVRVLAYANHSDAGNYARALKISAETGQTPDIDNTLKTGTLKYGTGVSWDQEIYKDFGAFLRLGWNDGKTQSFAFTAMDRLASGGVSLAGTRWHRKDDTVATGLFVGGISGVHASYLAHGGLDFIIGDGKLQYGPEYSWESYYSARLLPGVYTTFDLQHIANPAYNQSRGPVWAESVRVHLEFGKK